MKTNLLLFFFVVYAVTITRAQIPNGDFENWTSMSGYSNPNGWDDLDAMTSSMSTYTCMKGTPGVTGTSYLKLISKTVSGIGVVPGIAVCGKINTTSMSVASGFAFSQRPKSLTGSWQYMASGSDQGFVDVTLTKWNSTTKKHDIISMTHNPLSGMAMSWTTFTINLNYQNNAAPDSASIVLSSSGSSPVANSYLYVDNLAFAGTASGINEPVINSDQVSIYPNPVSGNTLFIGNTGPKMNFSNIQVLDMQGRQIMQIQSAFSSRNSIDIQKLDRGQYILVLTGNEGIIRKSFIKQ